MKTSIKSNLFFITYGIFLTFIVGLIVLSNTFLEQFYRSQREENIIVAFSELKDLDLASEDLSSSIINIENSYNVNIQIIKEVNVDPSDIPVDDPGNFNLPIPFERIYGNQFSIRENVIAKIMYDFENPDTPTGTITTSVEYNDIFADEGFTLYTANLTPNPNAEQEDNQMISLIAEKEDTDGLNLYYIITITLQSIQDSVSVFNSFTIILAVGFMILSAFIVYFASYKFTTPILQITEVTKNLANLDFSSKVEIKSNDELGVLGESINKMSTELEGSILKLKEANVQLSKDIELKTKIDDMRKEFIASASHELKTPISLILGYSEALKLSGLDEETIEDYLNIIIDESNKMNKLVMGLLKLSQLETGFLDFNMSSFDLRSLSQETMRLFKVKFDEQEIKITEDVESVEITSDYDQLQTVLTNFISNALHHVDKEKEIQVSLKKVKENTYRYGVFNTGKQISDEDKIRIWDSFYKVDKARTRSYGGQGLGLSIVRNILEQLHYKYGVENSYHGVTFYFEFTINLEEPIK